MRTTGRVVKLANGLQYTRNKLDSSIEWEVKAIIEAIRSYWLEVLFGSVLAGIGFMMRNLFARVKKEVDEQTKIKAGVLAILHDRLYQSCQHYILQGYIIPGDLRNVGTMHSSYIELGGNGTITEMFNRVKSLPLHKQEVID